MDAVGRIGRYISQGMYTVTGTFHPFGGAVDIIVVQQEDGSFKSSPWYVRFGKFQGVLKSKENVITISVNGVEAEFNMYLNSKGEAFFLRESKVGEGGLVLSRPTSRPTFRDEMEGPTKNGVFEKMDSLNIEDGQRELVTQVDNGNGKILTRTNSKGSRIFSFVFGRKSDNNADKNHKGDNVEGVTSIDHAEIAAGLFEMKWSTNPASSDQRADICVPDEQCPQANKGLDSDENINCHRERMDNRFMGGIASKNCSEEKDDSPSRLSISKETIDTYTTANSDQTNSNQQSSELIVKNKNPVFDPQSFDLDVDETGLSGNHMKNDLTENNLDEGTSHVKVCTMETGDSSSRNELISDLVTVKSKENDCHDTGSVENYDDASQSHTESCMGSTAGISTCKNGKEEIASFNSCEIIERPTISFNSLNEKSSECLDLLSCGIRHSKDGFLCNTSSMIPDLTSLPESVASLGNEISNGCHKQKLETLGSNELFVSEKSQYPSPGNGSLRDPDNSVLNTESNQSPNFEQISSDLSCFSNQELIKYNDKFICMDTRAKESANETKVQQIDMLNHFSHLGVREDSQIPSFPVLVSSVNSDAAAESHSISEIPNSSNSINALQKLETIEFDINLKKSYSLEGLNDVSDFSIVSKPTEAAEYSLEDVQFPFSDVSNNGAKEMNIEQANNDKVDGAYQLMDTAGRNVGDHDLQIKKDEQSPSRTSDDLRFHSGQINIHGCKISSGETELTSRSLPSIHSHIKDCGHNLQHSLVCSLKSVANMSELVVLKNEDSSSSKSEEKPQTEAIKIHTSDISDIDISTNNDEQQQDPMTSMNSGKFASASNLEEKPQIEAVKMHTSGISDIDISTNNDGDPKGPMTSMNSGKFASASKLEEEPQTEAVKIHTSGTSDVDISTNNDEDQKGPMTSMNNGKFASASELEEKPQSEAVKIHKPDISDIDISTNNDEDQKGPVTGMNSGKFNSASKLEEKPQTEAIKIFTSDISDIDISTNNDEDQKGPMTSMNKFVLYEKLLLEGMSADAAQQIFHVEKEKISEPPGVIPVDGAKKNDGDSRSLTPSQGSWNLWPFMARSKTVSSYQPACENMKTIHVDTTSKSSSNLNPGSALEKAKKPMMVQSLTPTSEELSSLNLKEGQNVVKFSFSTPMLGMQQVDARIYLWKWNTRIIVSDVDGTITKSDVLGQFMPLVGIDWSQTGVAHLFSAIKENGYQLLFLSARAISQAHLTRQFLFNLKQDGKALPDGPVIISPDGLFPSLYREVIRRAPHEFKISCLEVIKELFPPDCNPFYAGFGNRDTDEISYLKVGIPIGKIFIINPKGRIVVNRQVDTTSYASLHDLVNGIFPPMSSFEQEDYNSWNYWKLPLPGVDMCA